jgi:signal transduction histidine kinase
LGRRETLQNQADPKIKPTTLQQDNQKSFRFEGLKILAVILAAAGLYLTSFYSYLLFHSIVELFSVAIAWGVFALAWNSRRLIRNNYLLLLGIAYLFVGNLDLLHTLAYKGMHVFPGYGANLPTQLWIASRYLESLSFLIAPFFLDRALNPRTALGAYLLCFTLILLSIFAWPIFPACYVEGQGLTTFKVVSEYIICAILFGALVLLYKKRREFDALVWRLLVWSLLIMIVAELAFTFYVGVYDLSNLIGHYFKVISFYLVYKAIIETGLSKPFSLLLRDLKQAEEALRKVNDTLEVQVEERTAALQEANVQLRLEILERQNVENALRKSEKKLHHLASQILQVQEQERGRISRELHDDLGQSLIVVKLTMRKIYRALSTDYLAVTDDLENALEQLDSLIDKVRRISHNLSPSILEDFGLEAALAYLFEDFSATEELKFDVNMEKVSLFLSPTVQLAIYRIFQEALTNVSKHAAATEVKVQISRRNDHFYFLVADDGRGFDLAATRAVLPGERGAGLASIEERLHLLNGIMDIQSQKGHGTQLSFTLPFESTSPE